MHGKSIWLKFGSALLLAVIGGTAWAEEKQENTPPEKAPSACRCLIRIFQPAPNPDGPAKLQPPCCEAKFTVIKVDTAPQSDSASRPAPCCNRSDSCCAGMRGGCGLGGGAAKCSNCSGSCCASASCCVNGCCKGCSDASGVCCCKGNACCTTAEMKPQAETKVIRAILIVAPSMLMPGTCPLASLEALMPSLASMPYSAMPACDPAATPYLTVGMPGTPSFPPQCVLGREVYHGLTPLPSPMIHGLTSAMPYEMSPLEELYHWARSCSPSHSWFAYAPHRFLLRTIPLVDEADAAIRKPAQRCDNELIGFRVLSFSSLAQEMARMQNAPWGPASVPAPPAWTPPAPPLPAAAPAYYFSSGHNVMIPGDGPGHPATPAVYHLISGNMMIPPPPVAAVPAPVAPSADFLYRSLPPPPPPVPESPVPQCTGNAAPWAVAATMTGLPSSSVRITEENGKHYLEMTGTGNTRMTCKKMTLRLSNGDFIKITAAKQVKISNHLFKGCADQIKRGDEEDCWILEGNVSLRYLNRSKFALINADEVMIHLTDGRLEIKPVRFTPEPAQVPVVVQ